MAVDRRSRTSDTASKMRRPWLPFQRCADLRQVMEAVPQRMVLDEKLRGERRVPIEGYRGGAIQLVVGEPTNGFRCGLRVPAKEVERVAFRDGAVLAGVFRDDAGPAIPRDARDPLPARELSGATPFPPGPA